MTDTEASQNSTPLVIFDGDCGFCRRNVEGWKILLGDRVQFAPSQEVVDQYPQIPYETYEQTVVLVEGDGKFYTGAEAVYRIMALAPGKGGWLWCYRRIPGFAWITEWGYKHVAHHRMAASRWTGWMVGRNLEPSSYYFTRQIFLSSLGLIYLIAFFSLAIQMQGLVGSQGILPLGDFLAMVQDKVGEGSFWRVPTIFWLGQGDVFISWVCWMGVLLSFLLVLGIAPILILPLLWFLYLSLYGAGQVFLGYQWDILLLETGFLAIFLSPWSINPLNALKTRPSRTVLFLFQWLLFRFMFESGVVKILSGDSSWRDMTALQYHFESQPLPTWVGYWAHWLPSWILRESTLAMYGIELLVPFLIFFPRRIRVFGAILLILLQLGIMLTGNYGVFNILTIALCFILIPDQMWPKALTKKYFSFLGTHDPRGIRAWPKWILLPLAVVLIVISLYHAERKITPYDFLGYHLEKVIKPFLPFHLANSYGLFAVMTKIRHEVTIEGSNDAKTWYPYRFKYKPGPLNRRPGFMEPYMPRLDWQMWFAALHPPNRFRPWFQKFMIRLLEGSPQVNRLMESNPFPKRPPLFVRARIARYYFTEPKVKKATGDWWWQGLDGPYSPIYELRGKRVIKHWSN